MTTILVVIDSMLTLAVAAEWLRIFEAFSGAVNLPVDWVVLDFIQHAVGHHYLRHPIHIPAAMDKEADAVNLLDEHLTATQRSLPEVPVDVVARNPPSASDLASSHRLGRSLPYDGMQ
jgi:hypothetical protein